MLYSRHRSLWAGVSAKKCIFPLKVISWVVRIDYRDFNNQHAPTSPLDVSFSVDLTLLCAPLVTTFLGGGDNIVSSGNPSWCIAYLMWISSNKWIFWDVLEGLVWHRRKLQLWPVLAQRHHPLHFQSSLCLLNNKITRKKIYNLCNKLTKKK